MNQLPLFQFLDQHLGVAAALVVFLTARGREIVGLAFAEAAFGLKVSKRLRRERDQFAQAELARLAFDELDQLPPDALVFMRGVDVETGQFALVLLRVNVQRDTGDRVLVDFENVVIADLFLDAGAGALD